VVSFHRTAKERDWVLGSASCKRADTCLDTFRLRTLMALGTISLFFKTKVIQVQWVYLLLAEYGDPRLTVITFL
jgi:hypothetical protein